ncbi:MAG: LLM class flavin-dependent oxidoreductase [Actinomycetota bacterium]
MIRRAVGIPNIGEYADPRVTRELAALAEQHGWDGLLLWDHLLYPGEPVTDPQVAIAAAASATERITLGICVVQLGRRRPAKVAHEMASLDLLSGGRMVLGVGLGSRVEDFSGFGDDPDPVVRGRKTDEGLDVIAGLWTGEPFSYRGEHFTVDDVTFRPRPVQRRGSRSGSPAPGPPSPGSAAPPAGTGSSRPSAACRTPATRHPSSWPRPWRSSAGTGRPTPDPSTWYWRA